MVTVLSIIGFVGSIIFTTRSGLYILDIADHFITNYGLVVGGALECIIVGWILKATVLREYISQQGSRMPKIWDYLIKFTIPAILVYLLYISISSDLAKNYGDYPVDQLILFGAGWMLVCLVVALAFAFSPWKPEKLRTRHRPGEDELLV